MAKLVADLLHLLLEAAAAATFADVPPQKSPLTTKLCDLR
jgi:hypothetical protein